LSLGSGRQSAASEGDRPRQTEPLRGSSAMEIGILFMVSWLPASCPDIVITTCVVFAASLQVQTFRTVLGHAYTSTFTTGNLRNLSEAIFDRVTHPTRKGNQKTRLVSSGSFARAFLSGDRGAYATAGSATTRYGWNSCCYYWRSNEREPEAYEQVKPRGRKARSIR